MSDNVALKTALSKLDRPDVLSRIFHPRREPAMHQAPGGAVDVSIPVEGGVEVAGRFHVAGEAACNLLFFHGNGEIVADYDDLGPFYKGMGINFLPVDYRGYGRSTGTPTVTGIMRDCHTIFAFARDWLGKYRCAGPLVVMGRSLGSASALELASHYEKDIAGLIIESGFAYLVPLLELLGVDAEALGFREEEGFHNVDKIRGFQKPTLIIHAERDHIIPFSDGQALYDASPAREKTLLKIPGANHNDIFMRGFSAYMEAMKALMEKVKAS